jgi:hypothetical protein
MSMSHARFGALVAELAGAHGLTPPEADGERGVTFAIGGELVMRLMPILDGREIEMSVDIGRPPAGAEAAWHASLLDAGLFGADSGGGRFGITRSGSIVLRRPMPLDDGVDVGRLNGRFERLARAAAAWHERLREHPDGRE